MGRLGFLLSILALAALAAGCGGDQPASPSPAGGATAVPETEETSEEAPSQPAGSAPTGSFVEGGRMTDARMDHETVLLADGRILTVGGRGRGATIRPPRLERAEVYDPTSGEWKSVGDMSEKRELF